MNCRHCKKELSYTFIDLGSSPPSNSYLTELTMKAPENWYPLRVLVCNSCWLVQTEDFVGASEMFTEDYAYYSSYSSSWLEHAKLYVENMTQRFDLDRKSNIVEIASNDGYLLQYVMYKNIPCYGIEPTHGTAMVARGKGIKIIEDFFGEKLALELSAKEMKADLTAANNVLAHVPDINDFVKGFSILLKPDGVSTFEFPHLLNLVKYNQFDTIYHEHYSYLSLVSILKIFETNGLSVFDVDELSTHGGSLRIYAQRSDSGKQPISKSVAELQKKENEIGINSLKFYEGFQKKAERIKLEFLSFLIKTKQSDKKVVGYGAAAKGSTLMNFSGVGPDLLSYVVDKNIEKQGKYMPGSRIPIVEESRLKIDQPHYVVIFPWNIQQEIMEQLKYIQDWKGKFVTFIPYLSVI